jgi:hypothetical protein
MRDIDNISRGIDAILRGDRKPVEELLSLSEALEDRNAYFWTAIIREFLGRRVMKGREGRRILREAASKFLEEASRHREMGVLFLSVHALLDARECLVDADLKDEASKLDGDIERLYGIMKFDPLRRSET